MCECVYVEVERYQCSLPFHTAEQIGEIVRSHNMKGHPWDEKSCRWDLAERMPMAPWDMRGMDLYIVFYTLIFRFWGLGSY